MSSVSRPNAEPPLRKLSLPQSSLHRLPITLILVINSQCPHHHRQLLVHDKRSLGVRAFQRRDRRQRHCWTTTDLLVLGFDQGFFSEFGLEFFLALETLFALAEEDPLALTLGDGAFHSLALEFPLEFSLALEFFLLVAETGVERGVGAGGGVPHGVALAPGLRAWAPGGWALGDYSADTWGAAEGALIYDDGVLVVVPVLVVEWRDGGWRSREGLVVMLRRGPRGGRRVDDHDPLLAVLAGWAQRGEQTLGVLAAVA